MRESQQKRKAWTPHVSTGQLRFAACTARRAAARSDSPRRETRWAAGSKDAIGAPLILPSPTLPQEDMLLMGLVKKHGVNAWQAAAAGIPGRDNKSCSLR